MALFSRCRPVDQDRLRRIENEQVALSRQLNALSTQLTKIGNQIMATLQDITQAVTDEKTVEDSVLVLLNNIEQQLKDAIAQNNPAAMQAVVDQITAQKQTMADAVAANTPPPPPPPPGP